MIYNAFKEIFKEDCILSKVEIKDRIKEAIEIREITQSELAEKAKIDKSQLSSYISGKYKPRQNNIDALSLALNVNEAWLMGFDVPMERDYEDQKVITHDAIWDEVEELLQQAGYHIIASDGSDIVTITNSKQEIICSVHVYELVGIYQTLMENNNLSAQALITKAASGWEKIDSYFYGKEASDEVYQKLAKNILRFQGKQKDLNEIYLQLSNDNQERVLTYSKSLLSTQQLDDELATATQYQQPATLAAHHEGNEYTEDELKEIDQFKKMVESKRK